jgi:imidazoleglycerol phosphate synthase glutamine amidotransferase subunit HisH
MRVSIIDYGMGNLRSVQKAFEKTGTRADIITTARDVDNAHAVVLPGVGAFGSAIEALERREKALHPYEIPEVIALPVGRGSGAYLKWVRESVR